MSAPVPKRVFIVDDAPILLDLLAMALRRAGHEVGTANDGQDGIKRFREGKWDVVITDLLMPRMDGEELAAAFRAVAPDVPVIMMTDSVEIIQNPSAFFAFVAKPVRGSEILDLVASALAKAAGESAMLAA